MIPIHNMCDPAVIDVAAVRNRMGSARSETVLLHREVKALHDVDTKHVNQTVHHNPGRSPIEYVFEWSKVDLGDLRSIFLTANVCNNPCVPPTTFTGGGLYTLATIQKSFLPWGIMEVCEEEHQYV